MLTRQDLLNEREQIQEDLICTLDRIDDQIISASCQVIVNRYEQYDMKFCSFCGTRWEGQLDCSEKGRKWEDVVRKHGRSMYDNKRYDKAYWSVQWRLEDLVRGQWAKERCFNRRDAVVKYKDRIQKQGESIHFWEVRLVRVMEDLFIKQVLTSGGIGGKENEN